MRRPSRCARAITGGQTKTAAASASPTSALSRILRKPNDYQTITDFLLNRDASLYMTGNAYALALRNDRFEIAELHLMDAQRSTPQVAAETGDVFYRPGRQ